MTSSSLQVAPRFLFLLQRFEERLEIALAETLRPFALDYFEKECGPVFNWLGENLEEITLVIPIDENAEASERPEILIDVTYPLRQRVVVGRRNFQELDTAILKIGHRLDDVVGRYGAVLHAFAIVELKILLHLRLLLALSRLV